MNNDTKRLIDDYYCGELSPEELLELEKRLSGDPMLRKEFLSMGTYEGFLREWGARQGKENCREKIALIQKSTKRRRIRMLVASGIAAAACILSTAYFLIPSDRRPSDSGNGTMATEALVPLKCLTTTQAVASIHEGCLTMDGGGRASETLKPGSYLLDSGMASLDTLDGARIRCMAPAKLEISPARDLVLDKGVFLIRNQSLPASLAIQASGVPMRLEKGECVIRLLHSACEVLLISGRMFHGESDMLMEAGKALLLRPDGLATATETAALLGISALLKSPPLFRANASPAPNPFAGDPALVISYDFEPDGDDPGLVSNRTATGTKHRNGVIIGAARVTDRRRPGHVMEFSRHTDRIRIPVDLETGTVTFSARICVAGLDRRYNSIFMCDDFKPGALHWQIGNTGYLGVGTHSDIYHDVDSAPVLGPVNFGEWHHVATTCDASTGQVIHYLDGEIIKQGNFVRALPFKIGTAELGNWRPAGLDGVEYHAIRNFVGKMDDFLLFRRVLSPEEIRRLAEW